MSASKQRARRIPKLGELVGAARQRVAVNPFRIGWQRWRLLRNGTLGDAQLELVRRVNTKIHHRDEMYIGSVAQYLAVGLSAIECIDEVLVQMPKSPIKDVLDLPSGYGRELRFLLERFPGAAITACDLQREGVDFCSNVFGALPAYSRPDLSKLSFDRKFDLIWAGSLVTHFDRATILELFELFARNLNTDGVMIVTTHGDFVAEKVRAGANYSLPREALPQLVQSYADSGYAYADYSRGPGEFEFPPEGSRYGVSITSAATIRAIAREAGNLKEVYFKPQGWYSHQDVFAFQRS